MECPVNYDLQFNEDAPTNDKSNHTEERTIDVLESNLSAFFQECDKSDHFGSFFNIEDLSNPDIELSFCFDESGETAELFGLHNGDEKFRYGRLSKEQLESFDEGLAMAYFKILNHYLE